MEPFTTIGSIEDDEYSFGTTTTPPAEATKRASSSPPKEAPSPVSQTDSLALSQITVLKEPSSPQRKVAAAPAQSVANPVPTSAATAAAAAAAAAPQRRRKSVATLSSGTQVAIALSSLSPADAAGLDASAAAAALDSTLAEGAVEAVGAQRRAVVTARPHVHTKFCPRKKNVCPFAAGHLKSAKDPLALLEGETLIGAVRTPGGANLAARAGAHSCWYLSKSDGAEPTLVTQGGGRSATTYRLGLPDVGSSVIFGCVVLSAETASHAAALAAVATKRGVSSPVAQRIALFALGVVLTSTPVGPVNAANCSVHNTWIEGTPAVGETLSVYADYFGGVQGETVCWWMRVTPQGKRELLPEHPRPQSSSSSSDDNAIINGDYNDIVLDTLTLTEADVGCKLKFNCRPFREDGQEGAVATTKPTPAVASAADAAATPALRRGRAGPTAAELVATAREKGAHLWREGAVVRAQIKEDGEAAGGGEVQLLTRAPPGFGWKRRRAAADGHLVVASKSTSLAYKLTGEDVGSTICFVYGGKLGNGNPTPLVESVEVGPILPAPPCVTDPKVKGKCVEGSTLKATGSYGGGKEGGTKRWWRRVKTAEKDKDGTVEVTPPPLAAGAAFTHLLTADDAGFALEAHWLPCRIDGVQGAHVSSTPTKVVKLASPSIASASVSIDGVSMKVEYQYFGGVEGASAIRWLRAKPPAAVAAALQPTVVPTKAVDDDAAPAAASPLALAKQKAVLLEATARLTRLGLEKRHKKQFVAIDGATSASYEVSAADRGGVTMRVEIVPLRSDGKKGSKAVVEFECS